SDTKTSDAWLLSARRSRSSVSEVNAIWLPSAEIDGPQLAPSATSLRRLWLTRCWRVGQARSHSNTSDAPLVSKTPMLVATESNAMCCPSAEITGLALSPSGWSQERLPL